LFSLCSFNSSFLKTKIKKKFVAWFDNFWLKLVGIVFAAISTGFGEIVFLAMSSFYNKFNFFFFLTNRNVMSGWGAGTGGAGIFGALAYLALKGTTLYLNSSRMVWIESILDFTNH
jgi:hypothetical protein